MFSSNLENRYDDFFRKLLGNINTNLAVTRGHVLEMRLSNSKHFGDVPNVFTKGLPILRRVAHLPPVLGISDS